jgi:excalibur calcium-binding domain-containing protein
VKVRTTVTVTATARGARGSGSGAASGSGSGGSGSGSAHFGNCSEARAAGAAPVHRGDPGYSRHLDRDGDGVGCDS